MTRILGPPKKSIPVLPTILVRPCGVTCDRVRDHRFLHHHAGDDGPVLLVGLFSGFEGRGAATFDLLTMKRSGRRCVLRDKGHPGHERQTRVVALLLSHPLHFNFRFIVYIFRSY